MLKKSKDYNLYGIILKSDINHFQFFKHLTNIMKSKFSPQNTQLVFV